jgi:transcriptional regulator with PAS, ATPase and Fis domain
MLSKSIIETELFGCKKGAYTDAKTDRVGKIEIANGGTLFLDNINLLPVSMQQKLLNVIEDQIFTIVGDNKPTKINVRIVAAGNEVFTDLVEKNDFRRDLYERFVETIKVPSLTVRKEDMDFFISRFIKEKAHELGKIGIRIDAKTKKLIKDHNWEGNVRQLKNFIHRIVTRVKKAEGAEIHTISFELVKACLADELVIGKHKTAPENDYTMETALNIAKRNAIERALKKAGGNIEQAVVLLGTTHRTYQNWNKKTPKL